MRRLKQPGMPAAARAGERAFFVAEQFRLQQRLGDRAAIECDEGFVDPLRMQAFAVYRLCSQFFTRAGLALYQHRGGRSGEQHDGLAHPFHLRRIAAQIAQIVFGAQRVRDRRAALALGFQLREARDLQGILKSLAYGRR